MKIIVVEEEGATSDVDNKNNDTMNSVLTNKLDADSMINVVNNEDVDSLIRKNQG